MKIEKGYTYPQLIRIIDSKVIASKDNSEDYSCAWGIDKIVNFDLSCAKPLTKDMFVNPYKRPFHILANSYSKDRELFEEAEKKVIFEGWSYNGINTIELDGTNYSIYIFGDGSKMLKENGVRTSGLITLGDLFQATAGQLILKNVTI